MAEGAASLGATAQIKKAMGSISQMASSLVMDRRGAAGGGANCGSVDVMAGGAEGSGAGGGEADGAGRGGVAGAEGGGQCAGEYRGETSHCDAGHALTVGTCREALTCDDCGRGVCEGSQVLSCEECDFDRWRMR